ncbi:hypothetical protein D3C72_1471130 [compost metagenome]
MLVRIGIGIDAAHSHLVASLYLGNGQFHIPPGNQRHREYTVAGFGLHFCHRVVEKLCADEAQLGVQLRRRLATEAQHIGIGDLGFEAVRIHKRYASFGVVSSRNDVRNLPVLEAHANGLAAVFGDSADSAFDAKQFVSIDHPCRRPIDHLHLRYTVLEAGGCARRPKVRPFRDMGVRIDDAHVLEYFRKYRCFDVHG